MPSLRTLFDQNRAWAEQTKAQNPEFFSKLAEQQTPNYLWIGCSDSRVPASQVVGLGPGDLFVHRNVANVIVHTDLNSLSVIQYAVEALQVEHIIVCGHYGCGGVQAALQGSKLGLIDNWLRHIQDVIGKHQDLLSNIENEKERTDRLCELNVIEQVANVCQTPIVQSAWERGQTLSVHGWIYGLADGLLRDVDIHISSQEEYKRTYEEAVHALEP